MRIAGKIVLGVLAVAVLYFARQWIGPPHCEDRPIFALQGTAADCQGGR